MSEFFQGDEKSDAEFQDSFRTVATRFKRLLGLSENDNYDNYRIFVYNFMQSSM